MKKLRSRILKYLVVCMLIFSSIFPAFTVNAAIDASASAVSDTQIKLQWSWITGAATCSIYRDGASAPIKTVNINNDREYLSFTDSGLTPETQYTYILEMKDSSNSLIDRAEINSKTLSISKPVIISTVFDVSNAAEKEHTITIKWKNGSTSASGAIIKRADGAELAVLDSLSSYTSGDIVTYSFKDTIIAYKQPLQYTVTTKDGQGRISEPSSPVTVIPIEPPNIFAVMKDGNALISWADKTGIENFQLERSKHGGTTWGSWENVNATIPDGAANTSDTLVAAGTYRYRLSAIPTGKYAGAGNISEPVLKLVAPSNLVCTYTAADKVSLTWTNDANNEGVIKVEKKTDSGSFTEITTLAKHVTSYTDTDSFSPGQTYSYKVTAYDNNDNKVASNIASLSFSEPASPIGLKVAIVSNRNLRLSWEDKSDNETSFKIERRTESGSFSEIATTGANVSQYSDNGVSPDGTYTYRVCANNHLGNSPSYSNEVTVTALSAPAPEALTVKPVSSTQIDLTWTYYGSSMSKTIIERKITDAGVWTEIAEAAPDIRSYSDIGLKENTLYCYRIKALVSTNVHSEYYPGSQSYAAYTKLSVPGAFKATVTVDYFISLEWKYNSSETNINIERRLRDSSSYTVVASVSANKESWKDTDITRGKTYIYRIQARTNKNESDYSELATVTAMSVGTPTMLAVGEDSTGGVELTWNDNSDNESGFEIWRMVGSSGTWVKHTTVSQNINSYSDKEIGSEIQYYKVRAYISSNSAVSGFSNEAGIAVQLLEAPADFAAGAVSDTQIRLTWKDNTIGETGFRLERKKTGGSYAEIGSVDADRTMYLDNGLEPDTRYYYRLRAYSGNRFSGYSEEINEITKSKVVFQDLGSVTWARPAIENMAARGIINGIGGEKYAPAESMTKAQFVSILVRAFNLATYTSSNAFSDVKPEKWYYKELMAAKALGIILPDSSNNFYPEKPITREDMAVIICKTLTVVDKQLDKADTEILADFTDSGTIAADALQSVADLYKAEIMVGNGNGTLTPKSTATRAQAAVIISRIIDR